MNLIQYKEANGARRVGLVVSAGEIAPLAGVETTYALALRASRSGQPLSALARELATDETASYDDIINSGRLLSPIDHPDPAHLLVTGTGLTHLGSADARANMHAKLSAAEAAELTDSMKMFRMGLEGGKPAAGETGVQPEWFYKGDGLCVTAPEGQLPMPAFALDGGEEPEIAGIYVIRDDGTPARLGFCIGNEFSDHKMERINYLYLAHSKLRACAFGPELRPGPLPDHLSGTSRITRKDETLWEKPFLSGERNMSHSIANLEAHHFKYAGFRRPGDVHVHFFGTATLSFADAIEPQPGDRFEIEIPEFGRPLRSTLTRDEDTQVTVADLG